MLLMVLVVVVLDVVCVSVVDTAVTVDTVPGTYHGPHVVTMGHVRHLTARTRVQVDRLLLPSLKLLLVVTAGVEVAVINIPC